MGIEIEYPLGYASSGDTLFRDTGHKPARRFDLLDINGPLHWSLVLKLCSGYKMCLALPLLLMMSANGHCFTIASHFLQLFIGPRAAMYWVECSCVLDLGLPHVGNNLFHVQSVNKGTEICELLIQRSHT